MKRTYGLSRIPSHSELLRAYRRLSRATKAAIGALVLHDRNLDLAAAFESDNSEELSLSDRRVVAQLMHDRGVAFMLSTLPEAIENS